MLSSVFGDARSTRSLHVTARGKCRSIAKWQRMKGYDWGRQPCAYAWWTDGQGRRSRLWMARMLMRARLCLLYPRGDGRCHSGAPYSSHPSRPLPHLQILGAGCESLSDWSVRSVDAGLRGSWRRTTRGQGTKHRLGHLRDCWRRRAPTVPWPVVRIAQKTLLGGHEDYC